MKKNLAEFFRRGLAACGLGPLVLAVIYLILGQRGAVAAVPVEQVCLGIFSLTGLAFVAGGMNVIYRIEQLPLMGAILLHGVVLYIGYLVTYLLNGWLQRGMMPILIFTGIFAAGYLVIWAVIYSATRRDTDRINRALQDSQKR